MCVNAAVVALKLTDIMGVKWGALSHAIMAEGTEGQAVVVKNFKSKSATCAFGVSDLPNSREKN